MTCDDFINRLLDAGPQIIFLFAVLGGLLFIGWVLSDGHPDD